MNANRISLCSLLFLILLTISPRMFAQVAFDRSDFNTGTAPVSSVAYDFNRDGLVDLAVVNSGSNTVSIFQGNGNGTFTLPSEVATGVNPSAVRVGDFKRDGLADLAVLNRGDETISILLGNGDGSFRSGGTVALAGNSLVVKDFNRDGTDDLATVSGNTISVVLGNGDGTFAPPSNTVSILLNADHAVVFLSQSGDYPLDYPVWFPQSAGGKHKFAANRHTNQYREPSAAYLRH